MKIGLQEPELIATRSALNVLIEWYDAASKAEKVEADRQDLVSYRDVGEAMLRRFRVLPPAAGTSAEFELTPGDLSVLERALRMSVAKWQRQIKPEMAAEVKAAIRADADGVAALITKLRQERGLPW